MKSYQYIERPHFVDSAVYESNLQEAARLINKIGGCKAVYQIGGVSNPGISDLDMVAVFEDNVCTDFNLLNEIDDGPKYLFIHQVYGTGDSLFKKAASFSFFHHYRLLAGNDLRSEQALKAEKAVKTQIALEYLIKLFFTFQLQSAYGILQVRSILLHGKAISYDLEFLGVEKGKVVDLTNQLIELRRIWFEAAHPERKLGEWFDEMLKVFPEFLEGLLQKHPLYLRLKKIPYALTRNVSLVNSDTLYWKPHGRAFPSWPVAFLGKKYFRFLHRTVSFTLGLPFQEKDFPEVIENYLRFAAVQKEYNKAYLPGFLPLHSSLNV